MMFNSSGRSNHRGSKDIRGSYSGNGLVQSNSRHIMTSRFKRFSLRGQIERLLQELGSTDEAVARNLEAAGVKGRPCNNQDCVVARYLNAITGADSRVRAIVVESDAVAISRRFPRRRHLVVPLPPAVYRFIMRFDRRDFRNLLADPPDLWRAPGPDRG